MNAPSSCCAPRVRRLRRVLLVALLAAAALAPLLARPQEPEREAELVAEALFLCDALPPGGRDLSLSLAVQQGEIDPVTGEAEILAFPRLQLAMALGERVGFTVDVGFGTGGGDFLEAPGASLKLLLRAPGADRIGLAASIDLFGSFKSLDETEAGLGLGAIRSLGPVTLRASASLATGVRSWSPHLHGGASAAVALGERWRAFAELVADAQAGEVALAVGPAVKVALGEHTALAAGALIPLAAGMPTFSVQLTQSM
jgi:hypothetical protein